MCARPTPVPESLPSPIRASPRLVPVPCSPSGRYQTASVVVFDAASSAVASTPLRLRLVPQPPRASTARPGSPRARTAALDRVATPPREVEPALPGRRVVPAPAASLSSLARSPPPPAPLQLFPWIDYFDLVRFPSRCALSHLALLSALQFLSLLDSHPDC